MIDEFCNKPPTASFTVSPTLGTIDTVFDFNANSNTNNQDATTDLLVRWDWNNDGTYDTNYNTTKTATHRYTAQGTYTVKLEVKDSEGLTYTTTKTFTVYTGIVTDIDGNSYYTVQIGGQLWMAENLKTTSYKNGEAIPNVTDKVQWSNITTGSYCSYYNDESYVSMYGMLYNWLAVSDNRGLAPTSWHIPSDAEWKELEMYLGMSQSTAGKYSWRGTEESSKLKSTNGWYENGNGTNEYGFSALPGGYRHINGSFVNMSSYATFWSSTETNSNNAFYRSLSYYDGKVYRYDYNKHYGFCVRCIKD